MSKQGSKGGLDTEFLSRLHCPCVAMCLIESSHDLLSSGYAYDLVPPGRAVMERDSTRT